MTLLESKNLCTPCIIRHTLSTFQITVRQGVTGETKSIKREPGNNFYNSMDRLKSHSAYHKEMKVSEAKKKKRKNNEELVAQ